MNASRFLLLFWGLLALFACSTPPGQDNLDALIENALLGDGSDLDISSQGQLTKLGYTTQVGAFSSFDNALRLEQGLRRLDVDAFSYLDESGLHKVRFGDHPTYDEARQEALRLQQLGIINDFFIVAPEEHASVRIARDGAGDLRGELVATAKRFLGVPYLWGGESARQGFDCSGLTMVVYRLNGLNLPRNSARQYEAGRPVPAGELQSGDLVFFATSGGRRVSHVGLYIGNDRFIHSPRKGKTVRIERLSSSYFRERFVGGRTYL